MNNGQAECIYQCSMNLATCLLNFMNPVVEVWSVSYIGFKTVFETQGKA